MSLGNFRKGRENSIFLWQVENLSSKKEGREKSYFFVADAEDSKKCRWCRWNVAG